jgi:N-acyl-D-aspartate/D-glutamate deacylase
VGHSHLIDFPEALEAFLSRTGELRAVLGPAAAPGVDRLEELLRAGLAARARGDVPAAVARLGEAMEHLGALAAHADPAEGAMMRAMAERFRQALAHGALGEAREAAETMRARSGSALRPRRER